MSATTNTDDTVSALGPVNPASVSLPENEKRAPWVVRKLVESITGRIVLSSYESLRAAGTSIWGDSSPLLLPCIRFRDLAFHTVIVATGGTAAIVAPVMGPVSDVVLSSLGDSILVEHVMHTGFELSTKAANDLVFEKPFKRLIPIHSKRLETTGIKELLITLKYHHGLVDDAALGFYRSSIHKDVDLFAKVKDFLAVEKGWFSPYLFASGRRPIIPRSMKPDVIFCHGPFLLGDYRIGETLLNESASVVSLCSATEALSQPQFKSKLSVNSIPKLSNVFSRSRTPSPDPTLIVPESTGIARRLVILVLGLKPHRKIWASSARPGESVIYYQLLNGCPTIVVPVKLGAPLLAWNTLTLEDLWKVEIPADDASEGSGGEFEGIVSVLFEFLDLCVDWKRVELPEAKNVEEGAAKEVVKTALKLLVAGAIRSKDSKKVKKQIDKERSGIAMFRIP